MAELTKYQICDLLNRSGPLWLAGVDLSGANLWFADLHKANLRGANLQKAALEGANLKGAKLEYANLQGAELVGANLQGAELNYANLRGAELAGANLSLVKLDKSTTLPDGTRWSSDSDLSRFTDAEHPEFWRPSM
jgi:uncharacterized protein YjbI with pentapeptide repeats